MSIDEVLRSAVDRGELTFLPMRMPSDPQHRVMLLQKDVLELVTGPYGNALHERRGNALWADMEAFVSGQAISVCLTPRRAGNADFGLLEPRGDATWDYRSRNPSPGLRLIGCFAKADTFVAMDWWPRSVPVSWSNKEPLQDNELRWRIAIHECLVLWNRILPGLVPLVGGGVERYVSENAILV